MTKDEQFEKVASMVLPHQVVKRYLMGNTPSDRYEQASGIVHQYESNN